MEHKQAYISFCKVEQSIPIFMQSQWLDSVISDGCSWDVVLAYNDKKEIIGALTFEIKRKWGLKIVRIPILSPFCGIWIKQTDVLKRYEYYCFEKKVLKLLIKELPFFHFAHFRFSTALTDWQPFYWAGFKQSTRYTYRLNLTQTDNLFAQFNQTTQRNIRKAEKYFLVSVSDDLDTFLKISHLVFERQKIKNPIPYAIWQNIDAFLKTHKLRTIYFAQNTEGGIEAAVYVIFDKTTVYYLAGGSTEMGRKHSATYLLLHKAIEDAQNRGLEIFDFEGSMLPGIEFFFRGFDGVLTPYFTIWKYNNWFLAFVDSFRK